ncbi:hypothetical protein GCM10011575_05190 [Microlunatus endophyticus]|uniref:Polysaccharide pyruvyl transferase domain-containing protein n=1 Tax=Microlunatus endophyticus TaxID=1716077 RepID=A0A917S171_9ACTN|nr:polysaccharide pyruvyl transferase family protein [Microlunatus endophyticus]GGL49952.1 hypothetical protein GCM10011575_05190 [Microlunatus endophyticus]
MPRILMRANKDPFTVIRPEAVLGQRLIGNNTGNLLFSDSVHATLSVPDATIVTTADLDRSGDDEAFAARINEQFDHLVVPLANAFRTTFLNQLDNITRTIERLDIPVTVVGVGAQGEMDGIDLELTSDPQGKETVRRFCSAVLDRSAAIGVRGEITRRFLAGLGFGGDQVEIIGCPSLFRFGPGLTVTRKVDRLTSDSPVAVNITPHVPGIAEIVNANADRYQQLIFVGQEYPELRLLLWGDQGNEGWDRSLPMNPGHRLYREDRIRVYLDPRIWYAAMAQQHFAFGTRIHGNVAAILAGTPAVVLAHDSRVLELADYHGLPRTTIAEVGTNVDAAELYERADFTEFHRSQPENFARFTAFLERNDLEHIHQPGQANPDYERRLAEVSFPAGVGSLVGTDADSRQRVAERLNWLRQGATVDRARRWESYRPTFTLTPARAKPFNADALDDVRKRATHNQDRIDRLTERARRQQDQIKELTRIVQRQQTQLADVKRREARRERERKLQAQRDRNRLPAKVSRRLRRALRSASRRIGVRS